MDNEYLNVVKQLFNVLPSIKDLNSETYQDLYNCCRACGNVEKRASGRFLNHAVMPDSESAVRHKGVAVAVKKRARGE